MTKSAVLTGIGVCVLMTAGSAAASTIYSANQFTTVNSATFTLTGVDGLNYGSMDWNPVNLAGPQTFLNPPGATPPSTVAVELSGSRGNMFWEAYHRQITSTIFGTVTNRDSFGFTWQYGNTGHAYTAEFNVTFSQSVELWGGGSAWFNNRSGLTISNNNGATFTPFEQGDQLTAGTYTFRFVENISGSYSGSTFGLIFDPLGSPIPGSGIAAIGTLGLAGVARRRRR